MPNNQRYAYRVLGLAAHLTADVYAHKTRVPTSVFSSSNRYKNGMGILASDLAISWDEFKTKINNKITFAQIKSYLKEENEKKIANYEDAPGFFSKRFTAAQGATNKMLNYFFAGKAIAVDELFKQSNVTECKCAFLNTYVEYVYGSTRANNCSDYKFTPAIGDSWNSTWVNISYLSGK